MATHVKICGVTHVEDALMCCEAGADAIGLNFYPPSIRFLTAETAEAIARAVSGRALLVGVFVNETEERVRTLRDRIGLHCVQFHGEESKAMISRFLPHAYRAFRVRGEDILEEVRGFPGEHVLLDAYVPGVPGGSGARFDWSLATAVAAERKVTLAGGLTPENVAEAVRTVAPYCVDVASGVEVEKGRKDASRVRAFIEQVRKADRAQVWGPNRASDDPR